MYNLSLQTFFKNREFYINIYWTAEHKDSRWVPLFHFWYLLKILFNNKYYIISHYVHDF